MCVCARARACVCVCVRACVCVCMRCRGHVTRPGANIHDAQFFVPGMVVVTLSFVAWYYFPLHISAAAALEMVSFFIYMFILSLYTNSHLSPHNTPDLYFAYNRYFDDENINWYINWYINWCINWCINWYINSFFFRITLGEFVYQLSISII